MKKQDEAKKRLFTEALEMAGALNASGVISASDLRELEGICLSEVHELSAAKIKKLRLNAGVSQAVMARIINVSTAAIKQWERGERKPSGAALKLLNLVAAKGIEVVL